MAKPMREIPAPLRYWIALGPGISAVATGGVFLVADEVSPLLRVGLLILCLLCLTFAVQVARPRR